SRRAGRVCGGLDPGRDRRRRRRAVPVHRLLSMPRPRDDAELERVRALMAEHELDALVVRAPDSVLYLTDFWGMKGYDACVFPRDGEPMLITLEAVAEAGDDACLFARGGEPILITIEASADDAAAAWTTDVHLIKGYAPDDARPVPAR